MASPRLTPRRRRRTIKLINPADAFDLSISQTGASASFSRTPTKTSRETRPTHSSLVTGSGRLLPLSAPPAPSSNDGSQRGSDHAVESEPLEAEPSGAARVPSPIAPASEPEPIASSSGSSSGRRAVAPTPPATNPAAPMASGSRSRQATLDRTDPSVPRIQSSTPSFAVARQRTKSAPRGRTAAALNGIAQEMIDADAEYYGAVHGEVEQLKRTLEVYKHSQRRLEDAIGELVDENKVLKARNEALERQVAERNDGIEKSQFANDEMADLLDRREAEVVAAREETESVEANLGRVIADLELQLAIAKGEKDGVEASLGDVIADLERQLGASQEATRAVEAKLATTIADHEAQLVDAREEKEAMEAELARQIEQLEAKVANSGDETRAVESELGATIAELEAELATSNEEKEAAKAALEDLEAKVTAFKEEEERVEVNLGRTISAMEAKLVRKVSAKDLEIQQLKGRNERLASDLDIAMTGLRTAEQEARFLRRQKPRASSANTPFESIKRLPRVPSATPSPLGEATPNVRATNIRQYA